MVTTRIREPVPGSRGRQSQLGHGANDQGQVAQQIANQEFWDSWTKLGLSEPTVIQRCKISSLSEGRASNPPLLSYLPRLPQVMTCSHAPLLNILVSQSATNLAKAAKI